MSSGLSSINPSHQLHHSLAPMFTWPLQSPVLEGLHRQLAKGQLPHAQLFVGTALVTRNFTEFFAKLLLCVGEQSPCGTCSSCVQMAAQSHPDYIRVATVDGQSVKTGQIEELQSRVTRRSHSGKKVYVIEGVDKLSAVAANRLLRMLEEPQSIAVGLLTAESEGRVLATIKSRCFSYRLGAGVASWDDPLPQPLTADDEPENLSFAGVLQAVIQWTRALFTGSEPTLQLAAKLLKETEGAQIAHVLHVLTLWCRDLLHTQLGESEFIVCSNKMEDLSAQCRSVSPRQFLDIIDIVLDSKRRIGANVGTQLNVEQMCIRIQEVLRSV